MPHAFDTGLAAPIRTLLLDGVTTLLGGLKRANGGYLANVIPYAGVVRSYLDGPGIEELYNALSGQAPSIAVTVGDTQSKPQGASEFKATEETELLLYFVSNNMRSLTLGRASIDAAGAASNLADPGLNVMLAHAKELVIGQRAGITHDAVKTIRPDREEELTTRHDLSIWMQTFRITTSLSINPNRGVTQILDSLRVRVTQENDEVKLPNAATKGSTLDAYRDDLPP